MVYAYVSRPTLSGGWYIEKLDAYTLTEAYGKFRLQCRKYPTHGARSLVGGPSIENIEKTYGGKIY